MKTLIIKREATANKITALVIALVLSSQLAFAQNPSSPTAFLNRTDDGNHSELPVTRNTCARFLTTHFAGVLIRNSATTPESFFRAPFNTAKYAGFGLLGQIAAITNFPFSIPSGNGRLKASLSLKRDAITIQPKGPANFHYAAIDLKIKF